MDTYHDTIQYGYLLQVILPKKLGENCQRSEKKIWLCLSASVTC